MHFDQHRHAGRVRDRLQALRVPPRERRRDQQDSVRVEGEVAIFREAAAREGPA